MILSSNINNTNVFYDKVLLVYRVHICIDPLLTLMIQKKKKDYG